MIFFSSVLGILQCFILPGMIISKRIDGSPIFKLISIILISILFNFFFISTLISLNIYNKEIFYFLIIVEFLWIYFLYQYEKRNIKIKINIYFFISFIVFLLIIFSLYKNTGNVFYAWDAVVSYNEWAIKFSNGDYPQGMVRPYLIPKLWSLVYLISDNSFITLFSKFTTFIFPSLILLMCLDEILTYKEIKDFFKLILFCIFFYLKKNFILTGYVDIPLLSIIYSFFYFIRRNNINLSIFSIFVGCTIKLSSIFIFLYFCIQSNKNSFKKIILGMSIILYFVFLYYSKFNGFFSGEIFNEMGQNDNYDLINKLTYSVNLLVNKKLIYFFIFSFFGLFVNNYCRLILLFYVIPGFLYWSLLLSYDDRNFLFLIPGIIIINSIILEKIIIKLLPKSLNYKFLFDKKIFEEFKFKLNFKKVYIGVLILIFGTIFISNKSIIEFDKLKKNEMIGNKLINNKLIELINQNKINSENLITDFQLLFYIPAFKKYFTWNNYVNKNLEIDKFDYYLIYGHSHKEREIINKKIKTFKSKIILDINGFILVGPA